MDNSIVYRQFLNKTSGSLREEFFCEEAYWVDLPALGYVILWLRQDRGHQQWAIWSCLSWLFSCLSWLLQLLLVTRVNQTLGISDEWFAMGDSLILTVLGQVRYLQLFCSLYGIVKEQFVARRIRHQ